MIFKNSKRRLRNTRGKFFNTPQETSANSNSIVTRFARHETAAHLLMAILIVIGMFSLTKLNRQFFPDLEVPVVTVSVAWPGASAEDAAKGILDVLEPGLRLIDAVEKVNSYAREGNASISIEFSPAADMQKAQSDVEQAVASITTLPESAETPKIIRATVFEPVARIAVSGPFTEQVLKSYAKNIRDGLLAAGIDKVELSGARDEEIWVEVREADLRRLNLGLEDISKKIEENTQDLPAGTLKGESESQLRAGSDRETPEEIGKIEIKSLATGQKVYLEDIAKINTRFERDGVIGLLRDRQAIELVVKRSLTADTLKTMEIMQDYVAQAQKELPKSLEIRVYDVIGKLVQDRLRVLLVNGLQGLVLVLIALFIFLNARIAFWTAAGIPVAIFATLGVMWATGQTINMISMFGLIMMLGIIVDDAIIVGEHTAALEEKGMPRAQAAEQGALRMLAPVMAAILTTAAAFMPIFFIGDRIGDIMIGIPLVVLAALFASMIECFLILPGHLRHGNPKQDRPNIIRRGVNAGLSWFRDSVFVKILRVAFRWRYTTIAIMIGGLIISFGALAGERVRFIFFPQIESENALASIYFSPGVPRPQQIEAVVRVQQALYEAEQKLQAKDQTENSQEPLERLVETSFTVLGRAGRQTGNNLAEINAQLTSSEVRKIRTNRILEAWREALPQISGVERIAVSGRRSGPPGRDVDVRLHNAPIDILKEAAEDLKQKLTGFEGVSGIEDDLPYGKQELVFTLTPRGTALGFTAAAVGHQVRNAFEGAIAKQFARGDEEITVRVLRQQDIDGPAMFHSMYLRTPEGSRVALTDVVKINERQTFSTIQRREGLTTVAVTANVDQEIATPGQVVEQLMQDIMPALAEKYNINYSFSGRAEESGEAFKDLGTGAILAAVLIYIILAWLFSSFFRPLVVMSIIPFGFVGAVTGHYIMGYDLTLPSMIGLLGLSGILVNDSIVFMSRLIEREKLGETLEDAAVGAASDRLRAVLLTSLTTIGGLTPLMFETSLQAQFLIPLAITIVFGLTTATIIVLIVVPCLAGVVSDGIGIFRFIQRLYISKPADVQNTA